MPFRAPSSDGDDDELSRDLPMAAMVARADTDSDLSDGHAVRSLAFGGPTGVAPHMLAPFGPLAGSGLSHPLVPGLASTKPADLGKEAASVVASVASVGFSFGHEADGGWGVPIVPQPAVTPHLIAAMPSMPQSTASLKPDHTVPASVSSLTWCFLHGKPSELSRDVCALLHSQGLVVMPSALSFSISFRNTHFTGVAHLELVDREQSVTQCVFRRVSGDAVMFHDAYATFTASLPVHLMVDETLNVPDIGRFANSLLRKAV